MSVFRRQRKAKARKLAKQPERIESDNRPFEEFTRSDCALVRKAIVEGWDVSREKRLEIVQQMMMQLRVRRQNPDDSKKDVGLSIVRIWLAMTKANQRVEHAAWKRGEMHVFGPWAEAMRCPVGLSKRQQQAVMRANDEYFAELKRESERQAEEARKRAVNRPNQAAESSKKETARKKTA